MHRMHPVDMDDLLAKHSPRKALRVAMIAKQQQLPWLEDVPQEGVWVEVAPVLSRPCGEGQSWKERVDRSHVVKIYFSHRLYNNRTTVLVFVLASSASSTATAALRLGVHPSLTGRPSTPLPPQKREQGSSGASPARTILIWIADANLAPSFVIERNFFTSVSCGRSR